MHRLLSRIKNIFMAMDARPLGAKISAKMPALFHIGVKNFNSAQIFVLKTTPLKPALPQGPQRISANR